jgi:hypothetical protein
MASNVQTNLGTGSPSSGIFDSVKSVLTANITRTWGIFIVVLFLIIGIFTATFYNFSISDTIPFASSIVIILIVGMILFTLNKFSAQGIAANVITRFVFSLYFFMPYALFTFGLVNDAVTKKLQYIPAGFAGLSGVFANFLLSLTLNNGITSPVENPLCEIPGLSDFSSTLAPQSMMFTLSTLAYIATYISRSNIGGTRGFVLESDYIWPSWVLFFGVAALHIFVLYGTACLTGTKAAWGIVLPLVWGSIMGVIGFSTLERTVDKESTPADTQLKSSSSSDVPTATCSAGAKDGEFVCESFENGKLKTKVMTE